jgi:hypothetical protein
MAKLSWCDRKAERLFSALRSARDARCRKCFVPAAVAARRRGPRGRAAARRRRATHSCLWRCSRLNTRPPSGAALGWRSTTGLTREKTTVAASGVPVAAVARSHALRCRLYGETTPAARRGRSPRRSGGGTRMDRRGGEWPFQLTWRGLTRRNPDRPSPSD